MGQFWTPIPAIGGSLLHADLQGGCARDRSRGRPLIVVKIKNVRMLSLILFRKPKGSTRTGSFQMKDLGCNASISSIAFVQVDWPFANNPMP